PFPGGFQKISSGFLADIQFSGFGLVSIIVGLVLTVWYIVNELRERRSQRKYGFEVVSQGLFLLKLIVVAVVTNLFTFVLASYAGIPNILVLLFVLIVVYSFVMNRTVMGRHVYALGGNE
ncbi:sugar ABC transporter permease, partial [Clostridioides difficile]